MSNQSGEDVSRGKKQLLSKRAEPGPKGGQGTGDGSVPHLTLQIQTPTAIPPPYAPG